MVSVDNIPVELKERPQWLNWQYIQRGGGRQKVPTAPRTGQSIDHLDPAEWRNFEDAVRGLSGAFCDGIGFVFTADDDLAGVDLDEVLDLDTGEIEPWASELIERLDSYSEISPSGAGVKVFVRGEVPAGGIAKLRDQERRTELYDRGRFFTVTGRQFPSTPAEIRPADLEVVFDFGAATQGGDGGKFRTHPPLPERLGPGARHPELFRVGRTARSSGLGGGGILEVLRAVNERRCEPKKTEVELAEITRMVVNQRSAVTPADDPTPESAARRLRVKGLAADEIAPGLAARFGLGEDDARQIAESTERHFLPDGEDYGEVELIDDLDDVPDGEPENLSASEASEVPEAAAENNRESGVVLQEVPFKGLGGRRLVGRAIVEGIEPPQMLVPGLLYEAKIHALYGEPAVGKTIFALWAAMRVMELGLSVLYLDEEGSLDVISERLEGLGGDPAVLDDLFHYYQSPGITLSEKSLTDLNHTAREIRPALVVFDSWADFLALEGLSENDSVDITRWVLGVLYPLRDLGASVLLLDHVNKEAKGRGGRGSTAKLAKLDAGFKLQKTEDFDRAHAGKVKFLRDKDRGAALDRSTVFEVGGDGKGNIVCRREGAPVLAEGDTDLSLNGRTALDALEGGGLTYSEFKKASGLAPSSFQKAKTELMDKGVVRQDGKDKRYYPINAENSPTHHDSQATHRSSGSDSPTLRGHRPGVSESPMSPSVNRRRDPLDPTDVGDEVA